MSRDFQAARCSLKLIIMLIIGSITYQYNFSNIIFTNLLLLFCILFVRSYLPKFHGNLSNLTQNLKKCEEIGRHSAQNLAKSAANLPQIWFLKRFDFAKFANIAIKFCPC